MEDSSRPSILRRTSLDLAVAVGLFLAVATVSVVERFLPEPEYQADLFGQKRGGNLMTLGSIYANRTNENRLELAKKNGGSPESELCVRNGLAWLARHQAEDGSWSNECVGPAPKGRCRAESLCSGSGGAHAPAQTGLAILAFQGGGHFEFNKAEYSKNVERGLNWLMAHQHEDGGFYGGNGKAQHYMYEHGIATFAVTEACALATASRRTPRSDLFAAAQKAIRFIQYEQHNDGGWRYTPNRSEESDTSISGWQVLAIKTAKEAKISVSVEVIEKVEGFFKRCELGATGRTAYTPGNILTEATTGVGMLVHQFLREEPDRDLLTRASARLASYAERQLKNPKRSGIDYYLAYNCTLAMFQAGGDDWKRWNAVVRDRLIDLQDSEGCAAGSWPPSDPYGGEGGRIYSTALATLSLEVYYRFAKRTK